MAMDIKDFKFKKCFGQNFIKEDSIVEKIKNVANVEENSLIIEIGPGSGMLTKKLVETGNQVLAYEIDDRLEEVLLDQFKFNDNFSLIVDDFLNRNIKDDIKKYQYDKIYVIANLPYYITTPIINKIIDEVDVYKIVVMVQKEVGDRFCAKVGTKEYSSLSVFLSYYFDVKKEFVVSRNCFVPSPNVDSIIVSFTSKDNRLGLKNLEVFQKLIRDSFQFKRKNLRNNLKSYNLNKIEEILKKYGFDLNVRAEQLSLDIFVDISNNI